ncbi:MAG: type II secretion system F family protein [bacterium]|nr:type II secretion system F family protein [bacterium]
MNKLTRFSNNFFLRVSLQDQILFTRHLSIMIKTGMPLLDALTMLQKQAKASSLAKILKQAVTDVSNGKFLSNSFEQYENIFGNLFISLIRVGEASGILPENLSYISAELQKRKELHKKVLSAMIYPMIIFVAITGLITMLTVFIFPKILPVFENLNMKLPFTTRTLIWVSDFLLAYGMWVLIGIVCAIVALWFLNRLRKIKFVFHWIFLHTPIIKGISQSVNLTNFCRTLGMLLKSGMHIVDALTITADTIDNLVYQEALRNISINVQKGGQISEYLRANEKLFPAMLTNMISVGETTGNLSETLLYLSDFYESDVDDLTKNLSSILEPLLILFMGLVVGFVAVAIITPIYGISQSVSG